MNKTIDFEQMFDYTVSTGKRTHAEDEGGGRMYMMWFDDSAKKEAAIKIEEAVAAYVRHFKAKPNVVLVNEHDQTEVAGIQVRAESYIRRDNFWVGWEDKQFTPVVADATMGIR